MITLLEQAIKNYRQAIAINLNVDFNQVEREIDDSILELIIAMLLMDMVHLIVKQ